MRIDRWDLLSIMIWGCLAFASGYCIACIAGRKRQPLFTVRNTALFVFCCYGAALLYLTGILELAASPGSITLRSVLSGFRVMPFYGHVFRPIFQNFLLFLPLGFLVPSVTPKLKWNLLRVLLLGCGISLTVELLQGLIGRLQEMDDIIMNTCGAAAGYAVWAALFRRKYRLWQRVLVIVLTVGLSCAGLYGIRQLCAM